MKTLSISIITKNRKDILRQCLDSIYEKIQGIDYEIIVVDNNSNDGTSHMIMNEYKDVVFIKNKINLGVAGGRNVIIDVYKGDYLLFLDDDTKILTTNVKEMLDFMETNQNIGIVGCGVLTPEGEIYSSARRFPKPSNIIAKKFSFLPFLNKSNLMNPYKEVFSTDKQPKKVDFVIGAFQLIKRSAQKNIGKLDNIMKFGFQDADYCARIIKAGYQVWYYPTFEIIHYKGDVSDRVFSKFVFYYLRSYPWFYMKHRDLIR